MPSSQISAVGWQPSTPLSIPVDPLVPLAPLVLLVPLAPASSTNVTTGTEPHAAVATVAVANTNAAMPARTSSA